MSTPPARPPAADPGWLLGELIAARVLDARQAAQVRGELPAADPDGVAEFLVRAGLLTPFQAQRALAGEAATLSVGPYLLLEPIGPGSLGQVYRAVRRPDRRRYAVKVLPLRSMWNVLRAKRQVRVFAGLPPHPAVVPLADIDTADGRHFLAWPFVEGETFEQLVRRLGWLPVAHAARLMAGVADGLALCHSHDITHGLLKPSNLLLGPDRQAHLLDLGVGAILAENIADAESLLDTISTAHAAQGALDCAAPETLADPTQRTPAADAYSFGCVLYYLLAGAYPFPDGNAVDKVLAHQTLDPLPLRSRRPDAPADLAELVAELMRKDPAGRPADLAAVRDRLLAVSGAADAADLPAPPAEECTGPPVAAPFAAPPRADGTDDSVNFDVPDQRNTPTPPPAPADTPVRDPVLTPRGRSAARPAAPPAPPAGAGQVPPLPAELKAPWWSRAARAVAPWLPAKGAVQFSVFGPPALVPGQTAQFQVFAHPPEAFASVRTLSRAFRPDTELLAAGYARERAAHGAVLGLYLAVQGGGVAEPLKQFFWAGQTKPRTFDVYLPWETAAGPTAATLTAGLDGTEVARIPFAVTVLPRSASR